MADKNTKKSTAKEKRDILLITGGGLNTRFKSDFPKYLFPYGDGETILGAIFNCCGGFDEVVLIINSYHESLWHVSKYVRENVSKNIKCIVLKEQTGSPLETVLVSGVLNKYKHDHIYVKDCDTVFRVTPLKEIAPATFTVKRFGFQVNGHYSIWNNGNILEKPKIPFWKWLKLYDANIGCYVFPRGCVGGNDLRYSLFISRFNKGIKSLGVALRELNPDNVRVKRWINFESLLSYSKTIIKKGLK